MPPKKPAAKLIENNGSSPSDDADKLLHLAEELQERYEGEKRRAEMYAMVIATAGAVMIGGIAVGVTSIPLELFGSVGLIVAVCSSLYLLLLVLFTGWRINRISLRVDRERRALHTVVDMLRELESAIAEEKGYTALQRAEFRIRLSRFGIGGPSDPDYPEHLKR
jgi:hypothetical protein